MVEVDCFDLCDVVRLHLTTYQDYPVNAYVMKDGSGNFYLDVFVVNLTYPLIK
jgi:hypothetical protein